MGLEATVTVFPRDPAHRLVGPDLAAFVDRLSERLIALGDGAEAEVRAGRFRGRARSTTELLGVIDAARAAARGREDLVVRLRGPLRDAFSKFLGALVGDLELRCYVRPHELPRARLCRGCGWPLDHDATSGQDDCTRPSCRDATPAPGALRACWTLSLRGEGPDGVGERFVDEERRLEASPFFESLEGCARAALLERHAWA